MQEITLCIISNALNTTSQSAVAHRTLRSQSHRIFRDAALQVSCQSVCLIRPLTSLTITSSDSSLAPSLSVTHCSPSDHFPIFTKLSVDRTPLPPPTFHSFRCYHSIDIDSFLADLQCSRLITNPPKSLGSLLIAYNTTLSSLLDKHAPVITRLSSRKSKSNSWFTSTLRAFKSTVRHTENI